MLNINYEYNYIEDNPKIELTIDISLKTVHFSDYTINVDLQEARRQSFLEGSWDELALLKANDDKTRNVTNRLPYFKQ